MYSEIIIETKYEKEYIKNRHTWGMGRIKENIGLKCLKNMKICLLIEQIQWYMLLFFL